MQILAFGDRQKVVAETPYRLKPYLREEACSDADWPTAFLVGIVRKIRCRCASQSRCWVCSFQSCFRRYDDATRTQWPITQLKKVVRSAVEEVLDANLPDTYDRVLFKAKCDNVFELMMDQASHRRKWVE